MFADVGKYDEQGNLRQSEVQQLLAKIDHRRFCSLDDSGNLLEEEEDSVPNPEISMERSNLEADRGINNINIHQLCAGGLPCGSLPAIGVSLYL